MMRCVSCGRRLSVPAYTAPPQLGGWMLGPVCLARQIKDGALPEPMHDESRKRKGCIKQKARRKSAKRRSKAEDQLDLFM